MFVFRGNWQNRNRDRREGYRDFDRGRRDRLSPPRHDGSPPQMKRMRRDWFVTNYVGSKSLTCKHTTVTLVCLASLLCMCAVYSISGIDFSLILVTDQSAKYSFPMGWVDLWSERHTQQKFSALAGVELKISCLPTWQLIFKLPHTFKGIHNSQMPQTFFFKLVKIYKMGTQTWQYQLLRLY